MKFKYTLFCSFSFFLQNIYKSKTNISFHPVKWYSIVIRASSPLAISVTPPCYVPVRLLKPRGFCQPISIDTERSTFWPSSCAFCFVSSAWRSASIASSHDRRATFSIAGPASWDLFDNVESAMGGIFMDVRIAFTWVGQHRHESFLKNKVKDQYHTC